MISLVYIFKQIFGYKDYVSDEVIGVPKTVEKIFSLTTKMNIRLEWLRRLKCMSGLLLLVVYGLFSS